MRASRPRTMSSAIAPASMLASPLPRVATTRPRFAQTSCEHCPCHADRCERGTLQGGRQPRQCEFPRLRRSIRRQIEGYTSHAQSAPPHDWRNDIDPSTSRKMSRSSGSERAEDHRRTDLELGLRQRRADPTQPRRRLRTTPHRPIRSPSRRCRRSTGGRPRRPAPCDRSRMRRWAPRLARRDRNVASCTKQAAGDIDLCVRKCAWLNL